MFNITDVSHFSERLSQNLNFLTMLTRANFKIGVFPLAAYDGLYVSLELPPKKEISIEVSFNIVKKRATKPVKCSTAINLLK